SSLCIRGVTNRLSTDSRGVWFVSDPRTNVRIVGGGCMGPTAAVAQQVESLVAADPSSWELSDLESGVGDLAVAANRLLAVQMRVLAAFDARGGGQLAGFGSTADWLAKSTGIASGRAGWLVHTARALRDELPATAAALCEGTI